MTPLSASNTSKPWTPPLPVPVGLPSTISMKPTAWMPARLDRHGLVAAGPLDPVVLVPEGDAGRVGGDEPAVGDRDPMGVAGQIGQHLLGPGERPLAIDVPLGPMQWREIGVERSLVGEVGVIAEELQAAGVVR